MAARVIISQNDMFNAWWMWCSGSQEEGCGGSGDKGEMAALLF